MRINRYILLLLLCFTCFSCKENKTKVDYKNDSFVRIGNYTDHDIENLYILCKVWGFMRFHHPKIVQGEQNWDYELFRIMPLVLASKEKSERNKILSKWIKEQGSVKPESKTAVFDSVKSAPDFEWIKAASLGEATEQLVKIRNAEKTFYPTQNLRLSVDSILEKEAAYSELPAFPDVGYRLLTLFRYWNIIEYFFPYKYLIGESWDNVLLDFIPQFIEANNELDYHMLIQKLTASINDTHAYTYDLIAYSYIGNKIVPAQVSFIEGKAVVTKAHEKYPSLKKGDVIIAINDKPVDSIIKQWLPYTPASNYPTKLREISKSLLRTNDSKLKIAYERNGKLESDLLTTYLIGELSSFFAKEDVPLLQYINDSICYIYLGSKEGGTIPDSINAKGIIIDLRCYPNGDKINGYWDFVQLYPETTECAKFTVPKLPGLFLFDNHLPTVGRNNPSYFKGKKVILVNADTQSHAEYMAMRYQCAPNTIVVGNTTAGADGNIFSITLPGNILTKATGIGVYYPDGRETQRVGIIPDVEIKPTIRGIREDRDELLEEAIRIINESK